jgi:hypothetical protein
MVKISIVIIFTSQIKFISDFADGFRKMQGKPDNELRGSVFQNRFLFVASEVCKAQVFVFLPASDTEVATVKISVYHGSPHKIIDYKIKYSHFGNSGDKIHCVSLRQALIIADGPANIENIKTMDDHFLSS